MHVYCIQVLKTGTNSGTGYGKLGRSWCTKNILYLNLPNLPPPIDADLQKVIQHAAFSSFIYALAFLPFVKSWS